MVSIARWAAPLLVLVGCTTVQPPAPAPTPAPVASIESAPPAPPEVFAAPPPRPIASTPLPPLSSPSPSNAAPAFRPGTVEALVSEQSASAGASAPTSAAPPYRMTVRLDDGSRETFRENTLRFMVGSRVGILPDGTIAPLLPPPEAATKPAGKP